MGFLVYCNILPSAFSRYIKTLNTFQFSLKVYKFIFDTILHLIQGMVSGLVTQTYGNKKRFLKKDLVVLMPTSYQTHPN